MRRWSGVAVACVFALAACSGGGDDGGGSSARDATTTTAAGATTTAGGGSTTPETGDVTTTAGDDGSGEGDVGVATDASVDDLVGTWSSTYGLMVVKAVDGRILATYDTDEGTITLVDAGGGEFDGWWTETPSRAPDSDAGNVVFQAELGADGKLFFNGQWAYGDAPVDGFWTLTATDEDPPASLVERFDDPTAFVEHP